MKMTLDALTKVGMENDEFKQYFMTNIASLYPDAEDERGKRVMVNVGIGPGRFEIDFLSEALTLGFIINPGVLNTMAVTQKTDQLYGSFKSKFAQNLKALSDACISGKFPTSFLPWMVGMLFFKARIKFVVPECAFEFVFSKGKN